MVCRKTRISGISGFRWIRYRGLRRPSGTGAETDASGRWTSPSGPTTRKMERYGGQFGAAGSRLRQSAEARSAAEALSWLPPAMASRSKLRLRLPWREIRHEPNPWRKTWGNASRWILRYSRFGCLPFRRKWRWIKQEFGFRREHAYKPPCPSSWGKLRSSSNISCLYHVYIRGEAYLAAGQGNAAASEFQKILTTTGLSGAAGLERWRVWACSRQRAADENLERSRCRCRPRTRSRRL